MSIQFKRLCAPLSIVFLLLGTGCSIDPEYDVNINEIDTEVTVFEDGLSIPIGSTDSIALSQFLNSAGENIGDFLKKDENGALILTYDGNFSLTEQIAELDLSGKTTMDGIEFSRNFSYHLGEVNPSDFSIPAQHFDASVAFSGIDTFNPSIPAMGSNLDGLSFKTGLDKYKNVINGNSNINLSDKIGNREYSQTVTKPAALTALATSPLIAALDPNEAYDISSVLTSVDVPETNINVNVPAFKLHDEVTQISNITTNPAAKMVVSLTLENPYISDGSIVPDVNMDLSHLCVIAGGSNINLSSLVLNPGNQWSASKSYDIVGLATTSYAGTIAINENLSLNGAVVFQDAKTTANTLSSSSSMNFKVSVSFTNLTIESADIAVAPLEFNLVDQVNIGSAASHFNVPDEIKAVKEVTMDQTKPLYLRVTPSNLNRLKSKNIPYNIELTFPSSIEVQGTVDGKLTLSGDLADGAVNQPIVIKAFHPTITAGEINLQTSVDVNATVSAENLVVRTADLPSTTDEDIAFAVSIDGTPAVSDIVVTINEIEKAVNEGDNLAFTVDGLDSFGSFSITPEESPNMTINCTIPSIAGLSVTTGAEGIHFVMPDVFVFDASAIDPALNFSAADNSFTVLGSIPSSITLPIQRLNVNPVKVEDVAKILTSYAVSGKIIVPSGDVSYNDIQAASGTSFGIVVDIPKITASSISLDEELSFDINENYTFGFDLDTGGLLKSVDEVLLDDVYFNLETTFTGLPSLGSGQYLVDLTLTLPDFIVPNVIPISGAIVAGKIAIAPVKIEKIAGVDLSTSSHIEGAMTVVGNISASGSDINLSSLQSDISATLNASIANGDDKIAISKASGVFSYNIDEGSTISLDNLPDILKGDGVTPDLQDPQISLTMSTNLGISLKGSIELLPFKDGVEQLENKIVLADIALPYSTTAETTATKAFVICNSASTAPAGYDVLEANVSGLLAHLPDSIRVSIKAAVNETVSAVIEPSAAYNLDVAYGITVPLAFGEDFNFSTELDIDISAVSQYTSFGEFGIKSKVVNDSPFNLNVVMTLLDPDGVEIPQARASSINIAGSSTSDVEFYLSPVDNTRTLSKAHLTITVTAVAGVPLKETSFLQFKDLVAVLPGGITY